ncbi:hypothetical protein [Salinibacterium sp. ZJ450]|uniref:hypothetical protein n=1 Tax=Salinibacterium sp. ZJ450 TaxID=2708338 RepID=UPI00141F1821|nr:hypothetical protein [Salinibacterium sp. ZJ450]
MSAIEASDHRTRPVRFRWTSVSVSLIVAGLFLGSAVLQLVASLQRWGGSWMRDGLSIEDHLFDYSFPSAPWEPIGTAAELFGVGTLLLAFGVLVMPLGVLAETRADSRRGLAGFVVVVEVVLAFLVAGSFGVHGAHALVSGLTGTPSPLQHSSALGLVGLVGLIALILLWGRKSQAAAVACVFLIGSTGLGHILATYVIAPLIAGISHDTTPWSETVVAASTAAAGVAMLIAAGATVRRRAPRAA